MKDLDTYAASYEGLGRIERLLFISEKSIDLRTDALLYVLLPCLMCRLSLRDLELSHNSKTFSSVTEILRANGVLPATANAAAVHEAEQAIVMESAVRDCQRARLEAEKKKVNLSLRENTR